MTKKYLVAVPLVLLGFFVARLPDGQASFYVSAATTAESVAEEERVTTNDLGVADPRFLPDSPFYFFKDWGRGIRRVFTFDPVRRVELELHYADEKVAEARKLAEKKPEKVAAMDRALENYRASQERLKSRLDSLKENSKNPNVDKLLERLADRTVKHEKLFDELREKFEDKKDLKEKLEDVEKHIAESAAAASEKDDPAKFAAKLEQALTESRGSSLKHIRSVEIIDGVIEKVPEEAKRALERLRADFSERLKKDIDIFSKEVKPEDLGMAVERLPGDIARHSVILEEIQQKAERRVADVLKEAGKVYEEFLKEHEDLAEKAAEQIEDAEEKLAKLERKIREAGEVPRVVRSLANEALEHLKRAKAAFEDKKFGEAFGQARSAEVLARNAIRMLEEATEDKEDLEEIIEELAEKIAKYEEFVKSRAFIPELFGKIQRLLEEARTHLGFARDAFAKNDLAGVKLHIGHIRGFLHDLARFIEEGARKREPVEAPAAAAPTAPRIVEPKPVDIVCTQVFEPVCGTDGKTYSNSCFARVAGIAVKHTGKCEERSAVPVESAPPTAISETLLVVVPEPATIAITDEGFSPREVKVRRGAKVTWANKGARSAWPASDVHPVHSNYPGFDALRGLGSGETYTFEFTKVGSWKYHNHLNSSMTGVVNVAE